MWNNRCRSKQNSPLVIFPLVIFLTLCSCAVASLSEEKINHFMTELTYPQAEWRSDDFGKFPAKPLQNFLRRHQPEFYRFASDCGPMDFYQQYAPRLRLENIKVNGEKPVANRQLLKKYERDFSARWTLPSPPDCVESPRPPLYGSAWTEGNDIYVLRYGFTFYQSGLPDSGGIAHSLAWIIGDRERWHYLDIHGAVFYLLNRSGKAFALVLAQHNHFRSYVIGVDITPEESKRICFSKKSNEPYLCAKDGKEYVANTAPSFESIEYVITGKREPYFSGTDRIVSSRRGTPISYDLKIISDKDPLKASWAPLGPNLKIWGLWSSFFRDAAPGMDIYTFPALKKVSDTGAYFYFDPNDQATFDLHAKNSPDFFSFNAKPVLKVNRQRFWSAIRGAKIYRESPSF